jgi:WD40 repeat protein
MRLSEIKKEVDKKLFAQQFCKKYNIDSHTIDDDGIINVDGDVVLSPPVSRDGAIIYSKLNFTKLPVTFGKVTGDFVIFKNQSLNTLEGCPREVGNGFNVQGCMSLKSLEHGPVKIGNYYNCSESGIESFHHMPPDFDGQVNISNTKSTNLEGLPKRVEGLRINGCHNLVSLKGIPEEITGVGLELSIVPNLKKLDYLPKKLNGKITLWDNIPNLLSLFKIKGKIEVILISGPTKLRIIINKYLPTRDVIGCQDELIEAGLEEYARTK